MTRPADDAVPPATGGTGPRDEERESEERIVVHDRRRIDPNGTVPRGGAADATDAAASAGADTSPSDSSADSTVPEPAGTGESASAESGAGESDADEGAARAEPAGSAGASEAEPGKPAKGEPEPSAAADADALRREVEERTGDLKRVVAEYANYRRRVERDRALAGEQATGALLTSLLPVLDDLDRAREHGDLVGPFGSVAEQLVSVLSKAGLTPYGEVGDPFDPMHHEAVAHSLSPEVTEPTCVMVMRRGYRHGERMLRPAMVAVADPDPDAEAPEKTEDTAESTGSE